MILGFPVASKQAGSPFSSICRAWLVMRVSSGAVTSHYVALCFDEFSGLGVREASQSSCLTCTLSAYRPSLNTAVSISESPLWTTYIVHRGTRATGRALEQTANPDLETVHGPYFCVHSPHCFFYM